MALAYHSTDNGVSRVKMARLAKLANISPKQAKRCIHSLIEIGELRLIFRGNGRGNIASYQITLKPLIQFAEKRKKRAKSQPLKGDINLPPLLGRKGDIHAPLFPR